MTQESRTSYGLFESANVFENRQATDFQRPAGSRHDAIAGRAISSDLPDARAVELARLVGLRLSDHHQSEPISSKAWSSSRFSMAPTSAGGCTGFPWTRLMARASFTNTVSIRCPAGFPIRADLQREH